MTVQRDHFAEWCRLDHDGDWRGRLIVSLRAYLDLGATFDRPDVTGVVGIAGYLATGEAWIRFNRRWRALLRRNDIPDAIFHMTDYEARRPTYDWPNPRRVAFIRRLLTILSETAMLGAAMGVVRADYESLEANDRDEIGSLYRFCAASCMGSINRWLLAQGIHEAVDYIFELGDDGQGLFRAALNELLHYRRFREEFRIRSVDFKSKHDAPGLQTGDIAAFELCKDIPRVLGVDTRPTRKSLEFLREKVPHVGRFCTAEDLCAIVADKRVKSPGTAARFLAGETRMGPP